jgi:hypothetical protein
VVSMGVLAPLPRLSAPSRRLALIVLGEIALQRGRSAEAFTEYERAVDRHGNVTREMYWILRGEGK